MKYTKDQEDALINLKAWGDNTVKEESDLIMVLDGAAGTGKTTIVKKFIEDLDFPDSKIVVSAPTHKALKAIEKVTGIKGLTLQKLLGLRPNTDLDNFNVNRPQFDPLSKPKIKGYFLLIIDECSMVNSSLDKYLKTQAKRHNVKILFIGDSYQLPPVKERLSNTFRNKNKCTLTTVVRQGQGNPMTEILLLLRDDIKYATNKGLTALLEFNNIVVDGKGFRCLSRKTGDFGKALLEYFYATEYNHNPDYMKFITWTNKNVKTWSEGIRNKCLGDNASNLLNEGEILLSYCSLLDNKTNQLILQNSSEYIVTKVEPAVSNVGIEGFNVSLEQDNTTRTVFIVSKEGIDKFRSIASEKIANGKARVQGGWKAYYSFKEKHLLLETVYKYKGAEEISRNELVKKDLYYNYGLTTHKSQGSSYENVGINLNNLMLCKESSTRARLIYVALSRTKNINLIMVE